MPGFVEDEVRLKLDGHEVPIVKEYHVAAGILEVPAQFSLTCGHNRLFRELAAMFPPETPFELYINDIKVQSGEIDSIDPSGVATEARFGGRDYLRRLVDQDIENERTFAEKTFAELVRIALDDVGLNDRDVLFSNEANRKAITGAQTIEQLATPQTEEVQTETGSQAGSIIVKKSIKAEIGNNWFQFITEQNRRAGLFLWSDRDGHFVLTRPNGNQAPIYRIMRTEDGSAGVSTLGVPTFSHNTTRRFSECVVYGRGGGGKNGRGKVKGNYIDEEMVAILNLDPADRADGGKRKKRRIIKDTKCRTIEQCKLLAMRTIAESRRQGWRLSYTVPGHSTPALRGGGRLIWQPDTVVEVADKELGIEGPMYIENVEFNRTPHTHSVLRLMRCEDLIFAEEVAEKPLHRLAPKVGVVPDPENRVKVRTIGRTFWALNPNAK